MNCQDHLYRGLDLTFVACGLLNLDETIIKG
jgi:hypothetical protein